MFPIKRIGAGYSLVDFHDGTISGIERRGITLVHPRRQFLAVGQGKAGGRDSGAFAPGAATTGFRVCIATCLVSVSRVARVLCDHGYEKKGEDCDHVYLV